MRACFAVVAVLAACSPEPRTQTMVVVEADPEVRTQTRDVRIVVYAGPAGAPPMETAEPGLVLPVTSSTWPLTHAVVPRDGDASRRFRIEVTALAAGEAPLAHARAVAGFAPGETRSIVMRLYDDCIGIAPDACGDDQTCAETGACVDAEPALVPFDPDRDAGPSDGGAPADADVCATARDGTACTAGTCCGGECIDTNRDVRHCGACGAICDRACLAGACVDCARNEDCDDEIACTEDICDATGTCRRIPDDTMCTPSGNACMASPKCVEGSGCVEDISANGTPCTGGICWCGGCWQTAECGTCGGSCECLENDCQTPACVSIGACTP